MKDVILNAVDDLVSSLLFYDRKEDEDLSIEDIEGAFADGTITVDEVVEKFRASLVESLAG